jgi:spore coat protein U-like protein
MNSLVKSALLFCTLFFVAESHAFNCRISTTPVNFGSYDVFSGYVQDSTGTISVSCNNPEKKPIAIRVTLSAGGSGIFNPRHMRAASGNDRLNYYLFTDPSRTVIWGDGTGGSSYVSGMITKTSSFTSLVFGRILPGQNVSVGNYSDVLTATVIW